ncbi:Similar to CG4751: MPN domain-containing protein CG4751 (Drosophila melanogaster) [Cotesia congregata]|uniref:Similar to CG4751: MPN domain-containing protein CG4751 (Drosophila melanogaster) n=1 Tax=Cotesia congregata TaxID=51543 RepID=A0A8J2HEQ1_COTCN|nr:Similar to CG4751: MPN domain-containing protein CG4751 (Drosophila melanogaster) [Cotesia congregata]
MEIVSNTNTEKQEPQLFNSIAIVRVPVKHTNLGIRSHAMDMSTMVELTSFSSLGKIQPFLVTISTTAALIVDLHCHLTDKEVCGYLGGHWDINAHNLAITSAFPCRYAGKDKTAAGMVEAEIARAMEWQRVTLVGWYHSHPRSHASPSLRDVDYQLDYQIKMKGPSDNGYTPCVGLICSPYNADGNCYESNFNIFWSMPPPENRPHEYPRPMLLSYTISQESFLSQDALDEIKKCIEYYRSEGGINFKSNFNSTTTYLERLRNSLASKLPGRSRGNDTGYWEVIKKMILPDSSIETRSDAFITVQFPPLGMNESLTQTASGLSNNNVFLTPVAFKSDNSIMTPLPKFESQPSTSSRDCKKEVIDESLKDSRLYTKIDKPEIPPTFKSGELTVSVKTVNKLDVEPPTSIDFSKLTGPLSIEVLNKMRSSFTSDFPLPDFSQQMTPLPNLSKLANFSSADLAKLSVFPLNEITKVSPNMYNRNIANLFSSNNKSSSTNPSKDVIDRKNDYTPGENIPLTCFNLDPSRIDNLVDRKKTLESTNDNMKSKRPTNFSVADELSISSVRPDFGAMLDMSMIHGKNNQASTLNDSGESLNLSKDRS